MCATFSEELAAVMPLDSKTITQRDALASLLKQVGQICAEHEQNKHFRDQISKDLTHLAREQAFIKNRLVQVEKQLETAVSMFPTSNSTSSFPPGPQSPPPPRLVE